jgi:hypothetical protein
MKPSYYTRSRRSRRIYSYQDRYVLCVLFKCFLFGVISFGCLFLGDFLVSDIYFVSREYTRVHFHQNKYVLMVLGTFCIFENLSGSVLSKTGKF